MTNGGWRVGWPTCKLHFLDYFNIANIAGIASVTARQLPRARVAGLSRDRNLRDSTSITRWMPVQELSAAGQYSSTSAGRQRLPSWQQRG